VLLLLLLVVVVVVVVGIVCGGGGCSGGGPKALSSARSHGAMQGGAAGGCSRSSCSRGCGCRGGGGVLLLLLLLLLPSAPPLTRHPCPRLKGDILGAQVQGIVADGARAGGQGGVLLQDTANGESGGCGGEGGMGEVAGAGRGVEGGGGCVEGGGGGGNRRGGGCSGGLLLELLLGLRRCCSCGERVQVHPRELLRCPVHELCSGEATGAAALRGCRCGWRRLGLRRTSNCAVPPRRGSGRDAAAALGAVSHHHRGRGCLRGGAVELGIAGRGGCRVERVLLLRRLQGLQLLLVRGAALKLGGRGHAAVHAVVGAAAGSLGRGG
jgi:hypothetical protein